MMTSHSPLLAKYTHMHRLPSIFHTRNISPDSILHPVWMAAAKRPRGESRASVRQAGHHSQEKQPSLSHCHLEKPALLCRPLQRIKPQAHENMMTAPCIGKIKPPDTGGVFKSFWHSLGPHLTCQLARCLCQSTVCGKT